MNAIKNFFKDPKKVIALLIKLVFIGGIFSILFYPERFAELLSSILPFDVNLQKFEGLSLKSLRETLSELDLGHAAKWLAFAAIVKIAGISCGVLRWHFLLRGQGITLPFWYLTKCWFMGRAIGLFLPGTVGLDGYRLVESAAYTGEVIKCTTVVVIEKLIGFVALAILVFLTLPLGARLFTFNPVMLGAVLTILFCFIATAFLLLLNPRIVQVLAAALPVPGAIRHQVNKLGAAVTAYSGHRGMLMLAVLLGLGIHLGIVLMYFGTAMAMSGGQAEMLDVFFASPLIIVGSIIAPTVSGVGVREGVMTILLGGKYGAEAAFLFGHIALWIGEAVPFLLSVPLLLLAGRPNRAKFLAALEAVRAKTTTRDEDLHLAPEVVTDYRNKLVNSFGCGILGGLIGGALFGLAEGIYHMSTLANYTDSAAYWWAPLVYGLSFSPIGFGVGAVLVFFYLLCDRFLRGSTTFALSLGGTVGFLSLVIGVFRYRRDILAEAAMGGGDYAKVLIGAVVAALVCVVVGSVAARLIKGGRILNTGAVLSSFVLIVVAGFLISLVQRPSAEAVAFDPETRAAGPNIILIAVDTLRADFVKAYNVDAPPETPNISALAEDSVLFQNAFAQSSWTKASFGTIFSGMYPEAHTATGKASALPKDVTTIAEVLEAGGYYTRGYSNNPNITSTFNYDQGFADYIDLKPDLYFGAQPSCEKLVLYDILRKVVQQVNKRLLGGRIIITDFYQPGESITDIGLDWLDSDARPADTPFFLFLHYMDPHDPFRDPDRPGKGFARVQMGNPDADMREPLIRAYTYEVEYMDTHVGRLLDGLRERGLYDDALIVFTSDHGEEFYEHGGFWHGLSLYDEQIAIPLMMKLPGGQLAGERNFNLARHVDLAPTIAQFANQPTAVEWQGKSLFTPDLAPGNDNTPHVHSHLDFEGIVLHSIRTLDKKLIRANEGNKRGYAPVEFYDLAVDPGEQNNLAGENEVAEAVFQKALDDMDAFIKEGAVEPEAFNLEDMTQEQLDRLRSLGYLGGEDDQSSDTDSEE